MSNRSEPNFLKGLMSIAILVLLFVTLYFVANAIFKILSWLAIPMLIATLVINHKVVTGYFSWIWRTLNKQPILGVGAIALTIFGFPVVSGFLLLRAILGNKIDRMRKDAGEEPQRSIGEYIRYEEVDDEVQLPPRHIEEPPKNRPAQETDNTYDQLFE